MPKHDISGHAQNKPNYLLNHGKPSGAPSSDIWRQGLMDSYLFEVDASVLWKPIGPAPLILEQNPDVLIYQGVGPNSGEVTDIAIDPDGSADQVIYIATNDGGVWKTADGGITWRTTMDDLLGLSMGAVAVDPFSPVNARVVYAGTGNMYDGGREFAKGVGLYRSADGGSTWSIVDGGPFATVFAGAYITAIRVLAFDVLLVATSNGLYRSVDGGQNFGANDPEFNDHQPVLANLTTCLMLDSAQPADVVFAAVQGIGIMKSIDGGKTFKTNLFTNSPRISAQTPIGNIEVAQAELNPQLLYASVQSGSGPNGSYVGLFQSLDGGSTWANLPNIARVAAVDGFGQTDYDLTLGLDPALNVVAGVPNGSVFIGFQELWRSRDGGQTVEGPPACTSSQTHWDLHALAFSPKLNRIAGSPTPMYLGTDGGLYKSLDSGATWLPLNGAGGASLGSIGSNLLLGMDIGRGAGNNAYTYAGFQDTGCAGCRPGDIGTDWHQGINGDGGQIAVDPSDPRTVYGFDDGGLYKTADGGSTWQAIGNLPSPDDPTRGIALEQRGTDPDTRIVYVGVLQNLFKSADGGKTFLSLNLTAAWDITVVATASSDSGRVWVGVMDGSIHYSADAGNTWDTGSFQNLPGPTGSVRGIAIDPRDADRVAVVFGGLSGIHSKYRTARVFLTSDSGQHWTDISGTDGSGPLGNLPDLPMHSVVFDTLVSPSALIVANDAGVMRSVDFAVNRGIGTATWRAYGVGLPTVSCSALAIDNSVNPPVLRVGTYGRSSFELTRPAGPRLYAGPNLAFGSVAIGFPGSLPLDLYNCGSAPLTVDGIAIAGPGFALNPAPAFPLVIAPGASLTCILTFTAAAVGEVQGSLVIASNDPSSPAILLCGTRGVQPGLPRLATNPAGRTNLGTAAPTSPRSFPIQVFNTGTADLHIASVAFAPGGSADFSMGPTPVLPCTISPGGELDVALNYTPRSNQNLSTTLAIESDDPINPVWSVTVSASGSGV